MKLLLECARARPDPEAIRRAAAAVTNWDAAIARADAHGLGPLLYWHLKPDCPAGLRDRFHGAARQSLLISGQLRKVGDLFGDAGIPFMPFKGPVVAWSLYETPALREMSDLDLLIRPADLARAVVRLQSNGYRRVFSCSDPRFFRYNQEFPLDGGCMIDLHWGLLPTYLGLDAEGFWHRSRAMEIAGCDFRTFCPDDLLLFLCVHGSKHAWVSLGWLADLARLIDRYPIAWDGVFARARQSHLTRPLVLGLTLVRDLLGAPVPDLPPDPRVPTLVAAVRKQLEEGIPVPPIRFQLALIDRLQGKLRYWRAALSPTLADYEALRIPAALYPLYYLARPLRLLVKHTALTLRRLL